jgi:hypothetical protein
MMPNGRKKIARAIADAMQSTEDAFALWEDGSAAFGRIDEFSDLDFGAIVRIGTADRVAEIIKAELLHVANIVREYRQLTYHGDKQFFWQFEGFPPFAFVDISFIEQGSEAYRIDCGIHGTPIIHFDKCHVVHLEEENIESRHTRIAECVDRIGSVADLQPLLVRKHILRKQPLHAFGFYQRWMIQPLVELLRMKYCPQRSSFHMTYLMWDLPSAVTAELELLIMVKTSEEIERNLPRVAAWIQELLDELR